MFSINIVICQEQFSMPKITDYLLRNIIKKQILFYMLGIFNVFGEILPLNEYINLYHNE